MRLRDNVLVFLAMLLAPVSHAAVSTYHVLGDDPGAWPKIFRPVGIVPVAGGPATVVVVRRGSPQTAAAWLDRINGGLILVLEGESELANSFGFKPTARRIPVQSLKDARAPSLPIIWEQMLEMPVYEAPAKARVFSAERWEGAPLVAGYRQGKGAVLWVAVNPGTEGYERFPYLVQDLHDLGLEAPFRSRRLWAFFDSSYRLRVDLDYFAKRWRESGVAALQVAAWHFYDNDPERAAYLKRLIEACHRESILVYAWFELPHVSDGFWQAHPEWREKTALLEDAQLDWRKLMNLTNRAAFGEASKGVQALLSAYDWDGVNLAELYFESLEGVSNPARFTPMNDDVRAEYRQLKGVDPLTLMKADAKPFLDYRAALARRQQGEWIGVIDSLRRHKPHLDLVVTQIDDRFDTRVRDLLGADATLTLPLLEQHDFTYLIEDPATIWNLGPKRYPEIAAKYKPLTARQSKLAIDINIVDRYQDVYPTKQQTGTELFQLVNTASRAFPRVALYFEKSILNPDLGLLASAGAVINTVEDKGTGKLVIDSPYGTGLAWTGPALVDGRPWPVRDESTLWITAGRHEIERGTVDPPLRIEDFNGTLRSATLQPGKSLELVYESTSRALCRLSGVPSSVEVDGEPFPSAGPNLVLPRGQHVVVVVVR